MKDEIVLIVTVVAKNGFRTQLREALLTLVPLTEKEPGFIQYNLHEATERPGEFVFYEIWQNQEMLDLHSDAETMKAFNARIAPWVQSVAFNRLERIS